MGDLKSDMEARALPSNLSDWTMEELQREWDAAEFFAVQVGLSEKQIARQREIEAEIGRREPTPQPTD